MSYEPKTWECGDTITAEALNHLEQGVANAGGGGTEPLILTYDYEAHHLGATFGEIKDAVLAGTPVFFKYSPSETYDIYSLDVFSNFNISGDNEYGYSADVTFTQNAFMTELANTVEALDAEYLVYAS